MKKLALSVIAAFAFSASATDFFPIPQTTAGGSSAASFLSLNGNGKNAFVMQSGAKLCLDGTGCTKNLAWDGYSLYTSAPATFGGVTTATVDAPVNTRLALTGKAGDAASAIGVTLGNSNTLSTPGAKIASFRNGGVEQAFISYNGWLGSYGVSSPAGTLTLGGNVGDGASAVGVVLDNWQTLNTAGAKLMSVRNNGSEKAYIGKDGEAFFFSNVQSLGTFYGQNHTGTAADGAAAVAHKFRNLNALSTAGAKIAAFYSDDGSTEKASINKDGTLTVGSSTYGVNAAASSFYANGANAARIAGGSADGATTVGVKLGNQNTLTTAGAKIASFCADNANTCAQEKAYINKDGAGSFASGNVTVGMGGSQVTANTLTAMSAGAVTVAGAADDGASAVGVTLNNSVTLASATAKLVSIRNNGSEKLAVGFDGRLIGEKQPIYAFFAGPPDANAKVLRIRAATALNLPATLAGSQIDSGVAATGSTTLTVKVNGVSKGTLVWAAAGTVPTITFTATDIAVGDLITIENQATADITLADISITLLATTR